MEALAGLVSFCRQEEIPFYVMGNGSNLLVGDKGYRGVIIQVYKNLNRIEITENRIMAQAGAMLSAVARKALEHSLTGFEFASGIPGTLGGAVVMNRRRLRRRDERRNPAGEGADAGGRLCADPRP